jgi:REP element-mobilizing transposase RayT
MKEHFEAFSLPSGYLLTFRTHGTWLHGDSRGSVDRFHKIYGTSLLPPNRQRQKYERKLLKRRPVTLNARQRKAVEAGIRETCDIRKWTLWTVNVRTNHVHAVVSANCKPDLIMTALKANATRCMKEAGLWTSAIGPWVYRGSKRYLWTEKQLNDAIAYVMYDQGEPLP